MEIEKLLKQRCPVCKKRIKIDEYELYRAILKGRQWFFCSHSCAAKFHAPRICPKEEMIRRGLLYRRGPDNPNWRGGAPQAEYARRARKRWPERDRARRLLGEAVKRGEITRPEACPICGGGGRIGGHHEDYGKPLDVIWKCQKCHAQDRIGVKLNRSPIPDGSLNP